MNVVRRGQSWKILGMLLVVVLCRMFSVPAPIGPYMPPSVLDTLFLSSLTSLVGLVAAWAVLTDHVFWAIRLAFVFAIGNVIYSWLNMWGGSTVREFVPIYSSHFLLVVIALSMMRFTGFRLTRSMAGRQFSLKNLLLFTSMVAVTLAIARAAISDWKSVPEASFLGVMFLVGGIFAAITLAAMMAALSPRRPLLWALLSCLVSLAAGIGFMLLKGSPEVPHVLLFAAPGFMQLTAVWLLRWRGWRLIRPKRAAPENGSPEPSLRAEHEESSAGVS